MFFNSYEKLAIINMNLEDDPRFDKLRDLVDNLPLYRGKYEDSTVAGQFKVKSRLLMYCKHA